MSRKAPTRDPVREPTPGAFGHALARILEHHAVLQARRAASGETRLERRRREREAYRASRRAARRTRHWRP